MTTNISNLRIGHLNVRGLEHNIDGIKLLLDACQYHIFAVSETKMKSSSPVGPVRVPGYNFVKHSLPAGRGRGSRACGGVGFYVRKGLKVTPIIKSTHDVSLPIASRVEYLALQLKVGESNIAVIVLYNPTGANPAFSQNYEKLLLDLLDFECDRTFVLGDFNINVASNQPSANLTSLKQINTTFNLTVLETDHTRITDTSSTTIDLMITDCPQLIKKAKASPASTISDHEVIYLLADVRIRKPVQRTVRVHNFRNVDALQLQADFQDQDFRPFFEAEDVNDKTDLLTVLTTKITYLLDTHAPERTISVRDERTPWITPQIKRATTLRDLTFKLYSRNPNRRRGDDQWLEYLRLRDRAGTLISVAKKPYADQHFGHDRPAKKLWSNLKREGIHNPSKQSSSADEIDADELNGFFAEGHRRLGAGRDSTAPPREPSHRTAVDHGANEFNFRRTNVDEVCRKIFDIHTNAVDCSAPSCSRFCPISSTPSSLPKPFQPRGKKPSSRPSPSPVLPKDFRPISVLPAISKVLEKILLDQITDHLDNPNNRLLARHQSGYRKGYGTTTALAKVTHDVYSNLDDNRCTVMVLEDFSLAFNCVDHRLLGQKLNGEFHFSRSACRLVSSFLGQRSQSVRHRDTVSSLVINSLPSVLQCSYQLYADDLQIYTSGPVSEINKLIKKINEDLEAITRWAKANCLYPNPKKTQAIVFCRNGTVEPQEEIVFSGETVQLSSTVTNLGLQMDRNMTWVRQVNDVVQRAFNTLRTFRRFAAVLSTATRRKLVQAVVMPIFTYCDVVYHHGLSAALKEQLNRCFKSAVRFVYNLRRRETTAAVRNSIFGHDLLANYKIRSCCFIKRGYDGNLPDYLQEHLVHGQQQRTRNLSSQGTPLRAAKACWSLEPRAGITFP
ncbi:uncharacterized protein LOC119766276 [Culex quinquefasciatus]|uniref:uncharacterized protein LOC119766276 n=1 Tax=Culex quinquefasciatus TaxID=7176 RepID=UPI0018E38556|nr:uncharacterized protein LOC119766276 [Culex quinquefasciatus]